MEVVGSSRNINFGRAFTTEERKNAEQAQKEAKKLLDIDKVILITPDTSLPAGANDIGVGQLNSQYSEEFYKFMGSYAGINRVKLLPQGELSRNPNGLHCAYSGSSLTLGTHTVNLEELTKDEMGNILSQKTFDKVKQGAVSTTDANFENVVGHNSPHRQAMREAFNNFKKSDAPQLTEMKREFEAYKINHQGTVESRALFEILEQKNGTPRFWEWNDELDRELFNEDVVPKEKRTARISELKTQHADEIEFTYFRQFMADKNLAKAKKKLNDNGMKLYGDCLIGFSNDEKWAHPKAFAREGFVANPEWGIRSLDYSRIKDENSEAYKLLKQKVSGFARRYDSIRFDVGWAYTKPIVYSNNPKAMEADYNFDGSINAYRPKNELNGEVFDKIENIVREVKGNDFDTKDLIYEVEAGPNEFSAYNWNERHVIEPLKNRTIVQSTSYLSDGYATNEMMERTMKANRDNYVYMVGNHDHLSLRALSEGRDTDDILRNSGNDIRVVRENQYRPLARELKLDENALRQSPKEFVKAKFGHIFLAKNIKMFFMDIFGSDRQFDSQENNAGKNYRQRVPANYEQAYHTAVQNNDGFNLFDSLAKAMRAKGLDQSHSNLYDRIVGFSTILSEKGALTEEEANKTVQKPLIKPQNTTTEIKETEETVSGLSRMLGKYKKYAYGTAAAVGLLWGGKVAYNKYANRGKLDIDKLNS